MRNLPVGIRHEVVFHVELQNAVRLHRYGIAEGFENFVSVLGCLVFHAVSRRSLDQLSVRAAHQRCERAAVFGNDLDRDFPLVISLDRKSVV